jgi:DNA-binding transcriptional ArsR family regulator
VDRFGYVEGWSLVSAVDLPRVNPTDAPEATFMFPEPVTHGAGITFHYDDTGLYDRARDLWRSEVSNPANQPVTIAEYQPDFLDRSGDFALRFRSSGWKAGKEAGTNGWRQWYKYHLTLKERVTDNRGRTRWRTPEVSLDIRIEPQVAGLTYQDGNDLSLPFGEGTRVIVQTTYPDGPEDVRHRTTQALGEVLDYDPTAIDTDSERLTKLEAHIRFDIDRKNEVIESLENSKRLIAYGGSADLKAWQERARAGWLEARIDTDRWDHLGFERAGYKESMKVYHMGDWTDRPSSDPLHHPKLEAGYQGGSGTHPRLSAWNRVLDRLQHKVTQQAQWAGLSAKDLIADPYYLGEHAPVREYPSLAGRRDDLRAYYDDLRLPVLSEVSKESTRGPFDILSIVLEEHGATYDELVAQTGLSRSSVRYHTARFEELGFVERVGNPVVVVFEAPYVEDIVRDVVEGWEPDTVAGKRLEREKRATERREKREGSEDASDDGATQAERVLFQYVADIGLSADTLARLMNRGDLGGRDVRVRWDESLSEKAVG